MRAQLLTLALVTTVAAPVLKADAATCAGSAIEARGEQSRYEWLAKTKARANWRRKVRATPGLGPTYANWGYQYWRQTQDGRLVMGGWRDLDLDGETGFETRPTPRIQAAIEQGLRDLVPEGVAIEHRWAGTMGFARDGRPLIGWLDASHHLAICAGFTGHGMGMAAACTQDLAELLSFRPAPGIATFDPGRFKELDRAREGMIALGDAATGAPGPAGPGDRAPA